MTLIASLVINALIYWMMTFVCVGIFTSMGASVQFWPTFWIITISSEIQSLFREFLNYLLKDK